MTKCMNIIILRYGIHLRVIIGRHFGQRDSMKKEWSKLYKRFVLYVWNTFKLQKLVGRKNECYQASHKTDLVQCAADSLL